MEPHLYSLLASLVLVLHLGVILFNVVGLVAIPLGAWRGWRFVRLFWWRALHLAILAVVALQAILDRACFLTLWQAALRQGAGEAASPGPLIQGWIERAIFWPLPLWFFATLYIAVWIYALLLWRLVPPQLPAGMRRLTPRPQPRPPA
jgi:Protein of Unknown function (DUF2784)